MQLLDRNKHHHWLEQEILRLLSIKSTMLGSTSRALEALFCSTTQMQKHNPYSDSPQNSATFEYKFDLLLNSPSRPPLDMNPNGAPCQIHTVSYIVDLPKKLFFLDFCAQ
jgi:hypothetical protein